MIVCILILPVFILLFSISVFSLKPNVFLVQPANNQVFNSTNNITFICNTTDEYAIRNISFYHNINGEFVSNQTRYYGEFRNDGNTLLLCHFNGNYICADGEEGNYSETSFSSGKFNQGVLVNDTDTLTYYTASNFDRNQGTIEFWVKPLDDVSSGSFYIVHVGNDILSDSNELLIYIDSYAIWFEIYDEEYGVTGIPSQITHDISYWQTENWYHIAAVWDLNGDVGNGKHMDLFVNAFNNSNNYNIQSEIPYTSTSDKLFIGSGKWESNQVNAIIDELRISSSARSASEINQSYQSGLQSYGNVSANWTIYNIPDGTYIWNCLVYDNDSESNWSSANYTFSIDLQTPPSVNSITLSPNSTDDVDPDVMINVTANVTDLSGVSTVIFQYRWHGIPTWTNTTMNNISADLWNASFTPYDGIWYYRIWSNDTLGHANYTQTYSLSVEKDYTWTRNPSDLGTTYIFAGSTGNLGTLLINNTGDYPLNFDLSSTPGSIAVSYNITEPFDLNAKESVHIDIITTAPSTPYEYSIQIRISATTINANPANMTTNATLVSYIGGPYLYAEIMTYSPIVLQNQNINLSARLRNIGNETATSVWFNWTLPEGWINTSGNLSYYVGNLSNGSTVWNSLTVNIDPATASQGITTIYVNATSNESINSSDFKVVGVECNNDDGVCGSGCAYTNDDDCTIPITPEGGMSGSGVIMTAGAAAESKYSILMEVPIRLDVNRGETRAFYIYINNPEKNTTLDNITVFVAGYPQILMSIKPKKISEICYSQKKYFELNITAPVYFDYKEYTLNISVKGEGVSILTPAKNSTAVNTSRQVLLVVHKVIENAIVEVLNKSESAIKEMEDLNFTTITVKKLLEQAKNDADKGNYERSKEQAEEILGLKDLAFKAYETLKQAEQSIQQAKSGDLKVSETEKMYSLALAAFQREDYKKAEERANNALLMYAIEAKFEFNLIKTFYEYWWVFSVIIIIFTPTVVVLRRKLMLMSVKRDFENLGKEAKIINGLIENAQKKHFEDKIMSSEEYYKILYSYEKRLAKIKRKRAEFVSRMVGLFKPTNTMEILQKEYSHIQDLIKDVQKKHFELGVMSKHAYQKNMEELIGEIAEIQKNMEMIKNAEKRG